MLKQTYLVELTPPGNPVKRGDSNLNVRRLQECLCLNALLKPALGLSVTIDNDFGPATELAVKKFQQSVGLAQTGIVSSAVFNRLCLPMKTAFAAPTINAATVRQTIVTVARQHLNQKATELQLPSGQTNLGPWVRSYCSGLEGTVDGFPVLWCMGFVQTLLDQTASAFGRQFTAIMPQSLSCDEVAKAGKATGRLTNSASVRQNPGVVKSGDVFLLRRITNDQPDWHHAGLITAVHADVFETIEGNTNTGGSDNGVGVFARVRNFRTQTLDVFSTEGL
jgi:peptidoglycan hydrolase-like protein with peptidoglycan-binding domain